MTGSLLAPADPTLLPGDERRTAPTAVVLFGASGDLARRELLPALMNLFRRGRLPGDSMVVGVGRSAIDDESFRASLCPREEQRHHAWLSRTRYVQGGYDDPATYARLRTLLHEHADAVPLPVNRLYYLSTPAHTFEPVVRNLGDAGLHRAAEGGQARIVIEKPFGHDERSARALDAAIHRVFTEDQVYRIDHYLGKDAVQNILTLRFGNTAFQPMWHRSWVDNVQITVAESVGVSDRAGFYDTAGAARDMLQNHLLQILALTMMEPPASLTAEAIRDEKVRLLRAVRLPSARDVDRICVRGQYGPADDGHNSVPGYLGERNVDPASRTETYAALRLEVDNERWRGVPVYLRTGKRLARRMAQVTLQLRRPPRLPAGSGARAGDHTEALVLRIQPDPGLSLRFATKRPGHLLVSEPAEMRFSYPAPRADDAPLPYERLINDALVGDPSLFVRSDEIIQSWRIIDPVIRHWDASPQDVHTYPSGSWGPPQAEQLVAGEGRRWHDEPLPG